MPRWIFPLALVALLASAPVQAARVQWTATGTVTLTRGAGVGGEASVDDSVAITFSYENSAPSVPIDDIPQLGWTEVEYRDGVDLEIRIEIGSSTWEGTIASGSEGNPRTLEVRNTGVGPTDSASSDRFIARASAADGAAFPSFPGAAPGPSTQIELKFEDGSETAEGPDYLGDARLECVSQSLPRITSAVGAVRNGIFDSIEFEIDLASMKAELLSVGTIPLKSISVDPEAEEVTLTWPTQPGLFYIVQYLDEFLCWREWFSVQAIEEETTETFFPAGFEFPKKQLYRVVEE